MDYTLSVYLPEIALSSSQDQVTKEDLTAKAGLAKDGEGPLLLQLLKQSRVPPAPVAKKEETKQPTPASTTKQSPFTSKAPEQKFQNSGTMGVDDLIEEDIIADHNDIELQPNSAREDHVGASGNSASKSQMGVDQSIDTLNLDAYDYVEDVKITPRQ
jgi:hypothetical protein